MPVKLILRYNAAAVTATLSHSLSYIFVIIVIDYVGSLYVLCADWPRY